MQNMICMFEAIGQSEPEFAKFVNVLLHDDCDEIMQVLMSIARGLYMVSDFAVYVFIVRTLPLLCAMSKQRLVGSTGSSSQVSHHD